MLKKSFLILASFLTLIFSTNIAANGLVSVFSPSNHLNDLNGAIQTVFLDSTGAAWISTANKIHRYEPYQPRQTDNGKTSSYDLSEVYHLFELDQFLIAATDDDGFWFLDRDLNKFVHIETRNYAPISGVLVFSETQFLAITTSGEVHTYTSHADENDKISLYRSSTSSCSEGSFNECAELIKLAFERADIPDLHFYTTQADKKNHFHLSKSGKEIKLLKVDSLNKVILEINGNTKFSHQLPLETEITSIGLSDSTIILGSHRGLLLIDQDSGNVTVKNESNSRIKSNFVTSILRQSNRIFWLGTYSGVSFLKKDEISVVDSESCGLASNDVGGVFASHNRLILATYAGLAVAERDGTSIHCPASKVEDIPETRLMNIYKLDDLLIIGTRGQTITRRINNLGDAVVRNISWPTKLTGFSRISSETYAVSSMTRGLTLVNIDESDNSFFDVTDSAPAWSPIGLSGQLVLFIKDFKINSLALPNGKKLTAVPPSFSNEKFQFLTLSEDHETIIATTLSNYAITYIYEESTSQIIEKARFQLDAIGYSAILIDETLLIAQENGVSIIDLETSNVTKKRLTSPSGRYFNFNFGAVTKFDDQHLVLGTTEGALILPLPRPTPTPPPKLNFTSFAVKGEQMKIAAPLHQIQDITLPHDAYHFSAEFAVMDYINPSRSLYKYKLEGLDDDWIDGGHTPSATYTNLSPGDYTLKVIGANAEGVWNNEGISIDIIVKAAPWATWWAYTLYASFAIVALWLFKRYYDTVQLQIKAVALSREMVEATEGNTETLYHRIERFKQLLSSRDDLFQSVLAEISTLSNESEQAGEPNFAAEHLIKCTSYLHQRLISQRADASYYVSELVHLAFEQYHETKPAHQPKYIPLVDLDNTALDVHASVQLYAVLVGILEWLPDNYLTQQVISTAVNIKTFNQADNKFGVVIALGHALDTPSALFTDPLLRPLFALGEFSVQTEDSNPNQLVLVWPKSS